MVKTFCTTTLPCDFHEKFYDSFKQKKKITRRSQSTDQTIELLSISVSFFTVFCYFLLTEVATCSPRLPIFLLVITPCPQSNDYPYIYHCMLSSSAL